MSKKTKTSKVNFEGRKLWFFFSAIAALLTAVALFTIISQVTATVTYYVAAEDIPARTQITPEAVLPIVTSAGSEPINSLTLSEIESGEFYATYPLFAGDVVAITNTGALKSIESGLPEGFVVATFTAPASYAVGGKIGRGDYVDLIVVKESTFDGSLVASYFMQHVLVLDATVDPEQMLVSDAEDPELRNGIPTLYTVGVSPENAAKLAIATQSTIYVVKSAIQATDEPVPPMSIEVNLETLSGLIEDAGWGTDPTFGTSGKPAPTAPPVDLTVEPPTQPTPTPQPEEVVVPEETIVEEPVE
jgi:Flp pilus assembly protein CpaB